MRTLYLAALAAFLMVFHDSASHACTNLIVTKGASRDGSVMITYSADSHTRFGSVLFFPAADHAPGDSCPLYHYETGKYLGSIPEVPHTYSVVQFMNEYQVAVGETTFGGLDSLQYQPGALPDYGSLMRVGLQRAKTAREFIKVIAGLMEEYGYASSGESFSISDKNEAWIMEIIGKGRYEKGAVWVARLVPDGYVSGHANQARITTFPLQKANKWEDTRQTVYHSPDVVSFARKNGFYKGEDRFFSFSDVYNPVNFGGARFCDARVWSFFRKMNGEVRRDDRYTHYAMGRFERSGTYPDQSLNPNQYVSNRLPLWVKPDSLVSLQQVMAAMRDHYEETPLDMRFDPGAGPFHLPYRWRPMEFEVDGEKYLNERAIATQQTGYTFVAQSRDRFPDPIGGIFWFGVDDADGCVFVPLYCGIKKIPASYIRGNGSMIRWSEDAAFWVFSQVNNWCYTRYDMIHPEVEEYQRELENRLFRETGMVDARASELYHGNPADGVDYITDYSVYTGDRIVGKWKDFYHYLFMRYTDGNRKQAKNRELLDNGSGAGVPKKPDHPGYGKDWQKRMIEGTGDRLKVPAENSH